jgi:predicted transcriptional regulator of viral defense system
MKKKKKTQEERILQIIDKLKIIRPRDLKTYGIPRTPLSRLLKKGKIVRVGRGLYTKPGVFEEGRRSLIEVCKRVPRGVICLITALRFHDIGTQNPHQVWLAIDRKAKAPRIKNINLRVVRFSGRALNFGVEEHTFYETKIRVTDPAKTIADCFKYRNKIGLDVAVEAIHDGWKEQKFTMDELFRAARICRVENVIRPYAEALL